MLDVSNIIKLYKSGVILNKDNGSKDDATQPEWWADNKPQTAAESYSRDFLVGYLLHYCRLSQQMEREGTVPILEALLELEPDNGEVHFLLAQQLKLADNLPEALASFERAAALRPDKPEYALATVHVACLLGKRNRALELVCNVISAYPIMPEAYFERAVLFEADENWGRALRDYDMCSRLDPQNPAYLCAAAAMYRRQKLYKMARWSVAKALKLNPNYARAHEELKQLPLLEQFVGLLHTGETENTSPKEIESTRNR